VSKGIVKPSEVLSKLTIEAQTAGLSGKLQRTITPAGTPDAKLRLGYVMAFDPATWTVTAMIGDQLTQITGIPALAGFQPMIEQAGMFMQTGGDGTSQYTLIGMLGQGSTGGGAVRVRKSADQSTTNSTTLGADTHLNFYAQSERSYIFEAQVFVQQNSTTAVNFNIGWILPSGATYSIGGVGPTISPAAGNDSLLTASGQYRGGMGAVSGDKLAFGVEVTTPTNGAYNTRHASISVSGVITMSATSGLCSLGWCQNTGVAGVSTRVRAGSWLKVDVTGELLP
jgi:hypothetical protein